jgi:hypothetical protein
VISGEGLKRLLTSSVDGIVRGCRVSLSGSGHCVSRSADVGSVIQRHFDDVGAPEHPSRPTMQVALQILGERPARILETGTAAWGTKSTLLFSSYVDSFGGRVTTIDTRLGPARHCRAQVSRQVRFVIGDSARVVRRRSMNEFVGNADLVYLDSWDVDPRNPYAAAAHGLSEFMAIAERLKPGAQVLVDDTPVDMSFWRPPSPEMLTFSDSWGVVPGKGAFILKMVHQSRSFEIVAHEYQLLLRKL